MMVKNAEILGTFKYLVRDKRTNKIIYDSGYISNMILDSFFEKLKTNSSVVDYCEIGTGNSNPVLSQTELDNKTQRVNYTDKINDCFIDEDLNLIKYATTYKFIFNNTTTEPITEIGLGSNNTLSTRSLMMNDNFEIIAPKITSNEILEIHYRLWIGVPYKIDTSTTSYKETISSSTVNTATISVDILPRPEVITIGQWKQNNNIIVSSFSIPRDSSVIPAGNKYDGNSYTVSVNYNNTTDLFIVTYQISVALSNPNEDIKSMIVPTGFGSYGVELTNSIPHQNEALFFIQIGFNLSRYTDNFKRFLENTSN